MGKKKHQRIKFIIMENILIKTLSTFGDFRKTMQKSKHLKSNINNLKEDIKKLKVELEVYSKTFKKIQSTQGQILGEVVWHVDDERIVVKENGGPSHLVYCREGIDKNKLKSNS